MALLTLGRIISGLSGGANSVISNRIKARWFFYKELGLSFAAAILFDRLGSACAFVILGALLPVLKMRGVMWLAFGMTSLGALFILIISYLDNRKVDESHDHGENLSWIAVKTPGTLWSVVRTLDGVFWSISVIVFLYYGTVAVFTANGPNFLAQSYGFSESKSSYIIGLVYIVGLVTPVVGHLLDRYGYREYWMIGMALVLFLSLFLFCIVPKFPAVPLVLLIGLGFSIIGSLVWTSFTLVVAPENVGFALGFGKFFHYTGTGTTTAIAGAILNNAASMLKLPWLVFFVFSTAMAAVCVVISFIIVLLNRKTGYRLTLSQLKRSQRTPAQEVTPLISAATE
ncbi:hypothetical protein RvY_13250-2 [Ramazzottius varieornatus]|nr:hypothetical protein RvY_13250-2 [Ramazzottius varieornatus]